MRRFAIYWLPAIAWTGVILSASTDTFSGANTGSVLQTIVAWLIGHPLRPAILETANFILRKGAHITEYGIFGALAFRALRGDRQAWTPRWAIGAILLAASVASIDEIHQTFVPSRTGAWQDVVLDTAAATLAQIIIRAAQVLLFRPS
jgi:VanZ family protein